jgi:hypothetical protein
MNTSVIAEPTIQAYMETEYRAFGDHPLILKIGQRSNDLTAAYSRCGVATAAFITACNPFSRELTDAENGARQAALATELTAGGWRFQEGIGIHPSNEWPGEPSFLVFGLSRQEAEQISTTWEQNAFVWCGDGALPTLVLLR